MNWKHVRFTRKPWIVLAALAVVTASCSSGGGSAKSDTTVDDSGETKGSEASSPEGFDWKQFEGEEIRVVLNQHPWQEAVEPLLADFKEKTGISVEVEKLPEEQYRQRIQVELTSGSDDLDVFMTHLSNEGSKFSANGWYKDLGQFVEDDSRTSPDYDFDDFGEVLIDSHTKDDKLAGLPIQIETQMLFYRKDILEAANVEVPTTFEELEAAAKAIDDPDGVRAYAARGKGRAAVTQIATFLYNYGGEWTKPGSAEAAFDTPEGLEAFDYYTRMLREYGPKGAVNMSWEEVLPLFQQGQVAMVPDASVFMSQFLEEGTPEVVENIGFAPMPKGPGGDFQTFGGWALAMSEFTDAPDASWMFIQWATSPEIVEKITQEELLAGGRSSVDFGDEFPEEWVTAFTESLPTARQQLPEVIPVSEVRDVIGVAVVAGIEDDDLEGALSKASEDFDKTVKAAE